MSYHKLDKERVVYCDVDDTLLLWLPNSYKHFEEDINIFGEGPNLLMGIPHHKNIDFLRKLKVQNYGIVIWSAAGVNWAEKVVKKLGLEDLPDMIISKPELAMDDLLEPNRIIKSVVWIHPDSGEFHRNSK